MEKAHKNNISKLGFPKRSVHHSIDKLLSVEKDQNNPKIRIRCRNKVI